MNTQQIAALTRSVLAVVALLLAMAAVTPRVSAQPGLVHAGPDGIFVALGTTVLPGEVNGVQSTAYMVERREEGGNWSEVARVSCPATQAEFMTSMRRYLTWYSELHDLTVDTTALWNVLQTARQMKDLGAAPRLLPVQLAIGVRWLDTTVERARVYQYRVSHVTADGSTVEDRTTPTIVYPAIPDMAPLMVHDTYGEQQQAEVTWYVGSAGRVPSFFHVYRREGLTGPFSEMHMNVDSCCIVTKTLLIREDSMFCRIMDKTVSPGTVYQYYAVPVDYFLNEGTASDTASVLSFRMAHVPLPEFLKARSIDTAGIELRWWLRETSAVHGVVIERGPKIDSGFVELFTAGAKDTSYLDVTVTPMVRYYYRLRLIGPGGLRSPPSAVIIGIFNSAEIPTPPQGVRAESVPGGVHISWDADSMQNLDGWYVYRGTDWGEAMQQITPILPLGQTSYTDTSSALRGGYAYYYCVVSENTSHRMGAPSDTVSAVPDINRPVSTPLSLVAKPLDKSITLFWAPQYSREYWLQGFLAYRRSPKDRAWQRLGDTLIDAEQNSLGDMDVVRGVRYEYAVRAVSVTGDTSAYSLPARGELAFPEIYPPGNVRARINGGAVQLSWDEIAQAGAREFRVYRYTRGAKPRLLETLPLTETGYVDKKPGKESPVFYYIVTTGEGDRESRRSREAAIVLK
jgi:hypothetical protein